MPTGRRSSAPCSGPASTTARSLRWRCPRCWRWRPTRCCPWWIPFLWARWVLRLALLPHKLLPPRCCHAAAVLLPCCCSCRRRRSSSCRRCCHGAAPPALPTRLTAAPAAAAAQAGTDALAALGVNSALFTLAFVVFNFLATATTPMVAASLATGDKERAGKVTLQVGAAPGWHPRCLACRRAAAAAAGATVDTAAAAPELPCRCCCAGAAAPPRCAVRPTHPPSPPPPGRPPQALGLATVLGSVLAVVLVAFSDGALALMGAGPETGHVHELATEFLTIRWALAAALCCCAALRCRLAVLPCRAAALHRCCRAGGCAARLWPPWLPPHPRGCSQGGRAHPSS